MDRIDADALDAWLLDWPGVTADIKWDDDRVWSVGGKMFVVLGLERGQLCFKVEDERFLELTEQPGIRPAPYMARAKWIELAAPDDFETDWIRERITISYGLVAQKLTKAERARLGIS